MDDKLTVQLKSHSILYTRRAHARKSMGTESNFLDGMSHAGEGDNVGASPKTTAFLKECMADALLKAMHGKPLAKITVNEIAHSAGVNRSTWFRNFSNKEEALSFKLICLWERWADAHALAERRRYDPKNAETFFEFNCSIRNILSVIYAAGLQACVYDAFYQVMVPPKDADPMECYEARFYSYGLFGFLDEWIRRGFRETPEQLAGTFRQIISSKEKL